MSEQLTFFASLDFPGRTTLMPREIAERLGLSVRLVTDFIEEGALVALDMRSKGAGKRCARVPVECYRNFVIGRLTGPVDFKARFLRELSAGVRRQLIEELRESLRSNP